MLCWCVTIVVFKAVYNSLGERREREIPTILTPVIAVLSSDMSLCILVTRVLWKSRRITVNLPSLAIYIIIEMSNKY